VLELLACCVLPTSFGDFELRVSGNADGREQVVEAINSQQPVYRKGICMAASDSLIVNLCPTG
jgi:hypothetical protein